MIVCVFIIFRCVIDYYIAGFCILPWNNLGSLKFLDKELSEKHRPYKSFHDYHFIRTRFLQCFLPFDRPIKTTFPQQKEYISEDLAFVSGFTAHSIRAEVSKFLVHTYTIICIVE